MICPRCKTNINKFMISGDRCPACGFIFVLKNNMIVNYFPSTPDFFISILLPLVMTFIGTGILLLGFRHAGTAVALFGTLFTLTFFIITLSRTPAPLISAGVRYAIGGGFGGGMIGLFAIDTAQFLIGLSGGLILGAMCGVVVTAVLTSGGHILLHFAGNLMPRKAILIIYSAGAIIGAAIGSPGLYKISINIFGTLGGGIALFSIIGYFVGITIAYKSNPPYNPPS
jgi:hypothetical protein